jgi:hypothetical protein
MHSVVYLQRGVQDHSLSSDETSECRCPRLFAEAEAFLEATHGDVVKCAAPRRCPILTCG